jgi:hypothetical protein
VAERHGLSRIQSRDVEPKTSAERHSISHHSLRHSPGDESNLRLSVSLIPLNHGIVRLERNTSIASMAHRTERPGRETDAEDTSTEFSVEPSRLAHDRQPLSDQRLGDRGPALCEP